MMAHSKEGERSAPLVLVLCLLLLSACASGRLDVVPDFQSLEGWAEDDHPAALRALRKSCPKLTAGRVAESWRPACAAVSGIPEGDRTAARRYFEEWFELRTIAGTPDGRTEGLFTGYCEIELAGSRTRHGRYTVPLYRMPAQSSGLPPRERIVRGALAGKGLELLWVDDAIDAFFLEIQGSGRVRLENGESVGVGYAGKNGHSYYPIGRYLIEQGAATPENISMQRIRGWLRSHPAEAQRVMNLNPSYVFFKLRPLPDDPRDGPAGASGVALTPGRSLAVDPAYVPLGSPLWLDLRDAPVAGGTIRRLVVAQDTGGAIKGPQRGDMFWGHGAAAVDAAGIMKARGRYIQLIPRTSRRSGG